MQEIFEILLQFSQSIGYWGIILLMTIESSFIPFPSEVVIPPAAFLASQGEMNIYYVVLSGMLGSLIGACINYLLAYTLGRKIIYSLLSYKVFKILLITEDKIKKAEDYFLQYGKISTFLGRFVPAIRQLISIPAGFSKMNFKDFLFFTFFGSSLWVIILAVLGYSFGANQEVIKSHYSEISLIAMLASSLLIIYFVIRKKRN